MWLEEPSPNDSEPEGRKIGLFCLHNGISGQPTMVVRMNERRYLVPPGAQ